MVAADSTRHTSGDGNDRDRVAGAEYAENDRNENTEGTPGSTGCERKTDSDNEDDRRKEGLEGTCGAFNQLRNEDLRAEAVCHGFQCPCTGKDHDRGNHGLEAFGKRFHDGLKGKHAPDEIIDDGEDDSDRCAVNKTDGSVTVGESFDEADRFILAEEAAGVNHADNAANDQNEDRKNKVDHLTLFVDFHFVNGLLGAAGEQVAVFDGVFLVKLHRAVVKLRNGKENHHHDGHKCVEVEGNCLNEKADAVFCAGASCKAGNRRRPGRNRSDDTDGSRRSVNEVGELRSGNVLSVGDRTHNGAYGQTVEIVVDENQHAQTDGGKLCADSCFDVLGCPAAESGGTAGLVHHGNKSAEQDQE